MYKQTPMLYADQMQFIVATMTKDYEKARYIANKILKEEPDNTILKNYLSIFEKKEINESMRKRIRDNDDGTESDSESSTESNSDSNDDCDSDSSCQSTTNEDNERIIIEEKTRRRRFVNEKKSYNSNRRHNTEDNIAKFKYDNFKGKMLRVLPIILSDKISVVK